MKNHLYHYVKHQRGVGHTRLLIDGARNAQYPFLVVGGDMRHANMMIRDLGNKFAIPTTIDKERDYIGHDHPVLIDNYAFTMTCEAYMREIRDLNEALNKKEGELALVERGVTKIKQMPFWIRVFRPLYKKRINKCLEK